MGQGGNASLAFFCLPELFLEDFEMKPFPMNNLQCEFLNIAICS